MDLEGGYWTKKKQKKMKHRTIKHPSKFRDELCLKKYKDQNDRIGKIYRLTMWLDRFELKSQLRLIKDWPTNQVLSLRPIEQFANSDSEIMTHDGALQDDFSEQNWSWENSGTIISET